MVEILLMFEGLRIDQHICSMAHHEQEYCFLWGFFQVDRLIDLVNIYGILRLK